MKIRLDRCIAHIAEWVVKQGESLAPNYAEAYQFLQALDSKADVFSFRTFSDTPYTRHPGWDPLERAIHGNLTSCWEELSKLNGQGAAISVTINRSNGSGRKVTDMTEVRALFLDDDDPREDPDRFPVLPHVQVSTSPGHYHHYWLVAGLSIADFTRQQARLAQCYGGDNKVVAVNQTMQLPGFWRRKTLSNPLLPSIYKVRHADPYRIEALKTLLL